MIGVMSLHSLRREIAPLPHTVMSIMNYDLQMPPSLLKNEDEDAAFDKIDLIPEARFAHQFI